MRPTPDSVRHLRDVRPFSALTDDELHLVARNTCPHRAPAGTTLTREGRLGREWIVILDGTAVVRVGGRAVAHLGPGETVGEVALLDRGVRTATVVAESDVDLLVASVPEFDEIVAGVPAVARTILGALAGRLRRTDDLVAPRRTRGAGRIPPRV